MSNRYDNLITGVTAKLPGDLKKQPADNPSRTHPGTPRNPNRLWLPYPPSVNNYWRRKKNGAVYISAKGKAYRKNVAISCMTRETFTGRLAVSIDVHPPDNLERDLDNVLKALLDAMEQAGVYENDNQIDELHVYRRRVDPPHGHVTVDIYAAATE